MILNYFSNVTGKVGYYQRQVSPSLGDAVKLPSTSGDALSRTERAPAAARTTGGVYTAYCDVYPTCTGLRVARAGGSSLRLRLTDAQVPTIPGSTWTTPAPNGRMWLTWANRSGAFAVRSNKALTKWGPIQRVAAPRGSDTIWYTGGEGSRGFLDLFANITTRADGTRIYAERVKPALTLTPALCAVLLKPGAERRNGFFTWFNKTI